MTRIKKSGWVLTGVATLGLVALRMWHVGWAPHLIDAQLLRAAWLPCLLILAGAAAGIILLRRD